MTNNEIDLSEYDSLPMPTDDGACDHLVGMEFTDEVLTEMMNLNEDKYENLKRNCVIYIYPATGANGTDPGPNWDKIPGALGCTVQSQGFRELYSDILAMGYEVFGMSAQAAEEQANFKLREHIPFLLISDSHFQFQKVLGLPTFESGAKKFYKRVTLVIQDSKIVKVFYPVFPTYRNASDVLEYLQNPVRLPKLSH